VTQPRKVSVVINTDARAESLAQTLAGLDLIDYPAVEVVVVLGPTPDGSLEAISPWRDRIKLVRCPVRNLSLSRNLGIAAAAGDVVAFIDDDAYPEADWLDALVPVFDDPEVGGTGGPVWGHTGGDLQAYYCLSDRFASNARHVTDLSAPLGEVFNAPGTNCLAFALGANALFRREALVQVGGFDEQFEYYLDETDVSYRINDAGWLIRPSSSGYVHHKFLPSDIRGANRAIASRFSVLKNTLYFSLKHALPLTSWHHVMASYAATVERQRADIAWHVAAGMLAPAVREQFEQDALVAGDRAMAAWMEGRPGTSSVELSAPPPWVPFEPRFAGTRRRHIAFFVNEYPPDPVAGIGRVVHTLARAFARLGAIAHVITPGRDYLRVDLEDDVWVHRVPPARSGTTNPSLPALPPHIEGVANALWEEALRVHGQRPLDVVQVPNWDSLGAAAMADGRLPVVMGVYTPLASVVAVDDDLRERVSRGDSDVTQLLEAEARGYGRADALLVCGPAIREEVERRTGVSVPTDRWAIAAHGLDDRRVEINEPRSVEDGVVRFLFVGRLEPRKGIDVLLEAFGLVAESDGACRLVVAGDDKGIGLGQSDLTWRDWARARLSPRVFSRVEFLGSVPDAELDRLYSECDVLLTPSRFESFGLILVEAMMFGRPCIASDVGGMTEIVDRSSGLLVTSEDVQAWATAMRALIEDPALRRALGEGGRHRYEQQFTADQMALRVQAAYQRVVGAGRVPSDPVPTS
jgi:glycogen(starch) synthase